MVQGACRCRKVKNDSQHGKKVESYLSRQANVLVTHGICPDCSEKF